MLLRLDARDQSPIYLQIAASVRRALAAGEISTGDRLPPARTLAGTLGVNVHTVLRGYAELEREGLVTMRRGRGVEVCAETPSRAYLHDLLRQTADEARRLGASRADVIAKLEELLSP